MLQSSGSDVAIDMSRRSQGIGFARIANLVTSKNVNILKKEEDHPQSFGNGREVTVILPEKENEPTKQE